MTTNAVVTGSLSAIAQRDGLSLAESFLSADVIVLVDVSGSMGAHDSRDGKQRYAVALEELTKLQASNPGKIGIITFSSDVEFTPGGVPPFMGGGTNLAAALRFAAVCDGTVKFVVISDGEPDDPIEALDIARRMTSRIDTVFVGSEGDINARTFMQQLASAGKGQAVQAEKAAALANKVENLLLNGK